MKSLAKPAPAIPLELRTKTLTRNEWRGADWSSCVVGTWHIHVSLPGDYRAAVHLDEGEGIVTLEIGDARRTQPSGGSDPRGAYQVMLSRLSPAGD